MPRLGRNSFERSQDLAVPWEQELPPEKRRYDVRFIRGGPGKSGMGIVYLAYDREHDRPYAIKTFQDKFLGSRQTVENFKKEALVWVELEKHKNIVSAHHIDIQLGRPYIFLELVVGDQVYGADLSGWIRGKALNLPVMINFAIQFCRGMSHAEQRFKEMGRVFVHRDIKPQNIMVTRDKVVKVTDFGLVYAVRDEAFTPELVEEAVSSRLSVMNQGRICGTFFYMSPEQILQGPEKLKELGILKGDIGVPPPLDVCSDMYAFGCVLYEIVTGQPPFRKFPFAQHEYARYFSQTLYEEPVPVASEDRVFDELIMRLLRKAPEDREYRSFAELEEALQGIHVRLTGVRLKEEHIEDVEAWELVNRGLSFASLGQSERAIVDYEKAIRLNPGLADAYNSRGRAYNNLKQFERAIEDFNKTIELNPGYAEAYNNLGNTYAHLGQSERAIEEYNKAVALNPGLAGVYNNRGLAYHRLGQFERAIEDFNKTIALNPGYAEAYNNRGNAYAQLEHGQFERAIEDFNKTIALNPGYVEAYICLGNAYAALGQFERAIGEYDKAIALNPGYAEAYYNRGLTYHRLGQFERAIEEYNKAIALNPGYVGTYNNRGNIYTQLGQSERAIEDFNKAITLNPGDANAYNNRGLAYADIRQYERAILDFEKAIALNPEYAIAYYSRGTAYDHLGQFEQAVVDFRRFIELAPSQHAQQVATVKQWIRWFEAQIRRE